MRHSIPQLHLPCLRSIRSDLVHILKGYPPQLPIGAAPLAHLYREQLKRTGAIETLFRHFDAVLAAKGYLAMGGQIIDSTVIAAPKQKLTEDEKAIIKQGGIPTEWSKAKRRQKDRGAPGR